MGVHFFEKQDNALIFRDGGETLRIDPWGRDSLRVRCVFLGEVKDTCPALLEPEETDSKVQLGEEYLPENGDANRRARIINGRITADCEVQGWGNGLRLTFRDTETGKVLLEEIPNGGALSKKAREFRHLSGDTYRLKVSFVSDPEEKLFGMGQYQQERMNLKGCNLELAHRNSQASIPFVLSDKGYGFLWHNPAIGEAHFGLDITEWTAEESRQLDYWVTAGETPGQILENYTAVTGRAPKMPEYGLGYWQCKLRYYNQQQVLDVAREYHRRGIPLDVIVIDYYHWLRCGDWCFDSEYFPDPAAMVRELEEMGIKCMVSVWPDVDWRSVNFEEMHQQGLLVKSHAGVDVQMIFHGNNVFYDATNSKARAYVWNKCKENYTDLGVEAFWLDVAEPEYTGYAFENYQYQSGTVLETGNLYPREYARGFYEGQLSLGKDSAVNLIRCAWVGSQRYGALVWSGDIMSTWEDFRKQIVAGLQMGIAGIPWWTTDIGGFHGGNIYSQDFHELLLRWFAFGAFCPVMRMHGNRDPHSEIVNRAGEVREWTGAENEIWSYGEENYRIMKHFIEIREMLRDYTRSVMEEASATGLPVMRAMFLEFPEDEKCWEIRDQYFFGGSILVAPVCHKGAKSREVYLPAGCDWINAFTGQQYSGGSTIEEAAPLDAIPVYYRADRKRPTEGWLA